MRLEQSIKNNQVLGCVEKQNSNAPSILICRATIGLQPKIGTADENLILLPKKKTIVSVCTTNVRSCLLIYLQEPFASALSYSRLPSCNRHEKHVFACLFLSLINEMLLNTKPSLQNKLS